MSLLVSNLAKNNTNSFRLYQLAVIRINYVLSLIGSMARKLTATNKYPYENV